jgi:tripartite-type tricarboxylate transporter receptor subunit TctC
MKRSTYSNRTALVVVLLLGLIGAFSLQAPLAEGAYPEKPVTFIVPFPPGSSIGTASTTLATIFEERFKHPLVLKFKPGASGSVGIYSLSKEKADGYTLGMVVTTALCRLPHIINIQYDPFNDFDYLGMYGAPLYNLVVQSSSPWNTFKELVEYARNNPGKISYSTTGVGSTQQMAMEFVAMKENIKWTHIPFKGGSPALTAILGGHVSAYGGAGNHVSHVKAGTLRPLVGFNAKRSDVFPDCPILKDLGYGVAFETVVGVAAPAGLPKEIHKSLEAFFAGAFKDQRFMAVIKKFRWTLDYKNSQEFTDRIADDYKLNGELVQKLGISKKK